MNTNFKILQQLVELKIVDLDDFYSVSFSKYEIGLQGQFNPKLVATLSRDSGVKFKTNESGYVTGRMHYNSSESGELQIIITLT
jgi:hypothetical protein